MSSELRGPPDYIVEPASRPGMEELGSGDGEDTAGSDAATTTTAPTGDQS